MSLNLVPDYCFERFCLATPEFLLSLGVKGVILDVDNTLEPYENDLPTKKVCDWLHSLSNAGIKTAIVSNNNFERVDLFNKNLGMPAYAKAGKPFKRNLLLAMADMGTNTSDTIFMGDQILTDVWAAHNAGIRAILVPPIKDKRDPLTRLKRLLEKPVLKKYERLKRK
jgi:HAD superfamily phosphatase (TIGR01668 family)